VPRGDGVTGQHPAAAQRIHPSVTRYLLVGGDDEVGRVALEALDELAVARGVRREPLLNLRGRTDGGRRVGWVDGWRRG
jgi:hypothetical protein